jgi:NAD(P)-dependent dehydrogenase (short-subunit alcohol dehydrogenase family)
MLVTGGGRGIGAATAQLAGLRGFAVVVNYAKDEAGAADVVARIRRSGGQAIAVQGDVSVEDDVVRVFRTAQQQFGDLTALVNNAGVTGGFGRIDSISAAVLEHVLAVNVIGAFLCSREAVRRLSTRHGGTGGAIVNVSSRAAELGGPGEWVHYAASKGALDTLTVGLAREVADEGVRVNGVAAGLIETDLHAAAGKPTRAMDMACGIPMRRAGTAVEVAEAILWLCSASAAYVTGTTVAVSGGR